MRSLRDGIPDPPAALREFRSVLKSGGRLVVGKIFIDPDFPTLGWLVGRAREAGLEFKNRRGIPIAYFARCAPI